MMESHENPESDKIYPSAPLPPSAGAPLESARVYADNIAPEASEAMLQQFFSFCGNIVSLELADSTANVGAKRAVVTYSAAFEARQALRLNGALIANRFISISETPLAPAAAMAADSSAEGAAPPSQAGAQGAQSRPPPSVLAQLLAAGIELADDAAARARAFDDEHLKLGSRAENTIRELNLEHKLSAAKGTVSSKLSEIDQKIHFTERVGAAADIVSAAASEVAAKAMSNETVKTGVGFLQGIFAKAKEGITTLKQETQELVQAHKQQQQQQQARSPTASQPDAGAFIATQSSATVPATTGGDLLSSLPPPPPPVARPPPVATSAPRLDVDDDDVEV